ncbi:MAG: hypothetical protein ACTS41_01995 [Candidatus Hodgkinia cicadicola]
MRKSLKCRSECGQFLLAWGLTLRPQLAKRNDGSWLTSKCLPPKLWAQPAVNLFGGPPITIRTWRSARWKEVD